MAKIEFRSDLLTPDFCEAAIETYVRPVFEANHAKGLHTRREGRLLILTHPTYLLPRRNTHPYLEEQKNFLRGQLCVGKEFYAQFVAYEHTFGDNATGIDQVEEGTMTWKALQKAFGSFMREKDYDKVLHEDPEFVQEHGLTGYPGAVYGDIRPYATDIYVPGVVTSYNGVWWRHDKLYARAAFAGLEANLTPEIAL